MADDLLCWNVTSDDIRVREVIVDEAVWPTKSSRPPDEPSPADKVHFTDFIAGGRLDLSATLDPLVDAFKREHGLE